MEERASRGFDRRTVLKVGGLLGVGGALAGCVESVNPLSDDGDDGGAETTDRSGVVPDFAQGIAHGNVDALLADSGLRDGINQQIQTLDEQTDGYSGPTTVDTWLDQMEANTGVDPRKIHEVVGFWGSGAENGAVVLWTDWSESVLTSQLSDYSEETYQGTTLYVPEYGGPGAVLGDGVYAVGNSDAVRSVIDVRDGRAQGLSGRLRETYGATQGMARVAVEVPALSMEDLTGEEPSSGSQVEQTANSLLKTVEYASGSFFQAGNSRVMQVSLLTESADAAETLDGSLSAGRQLGINQLGTMRSETEAGSTERLLIDRMVTFGRDATISQNGETVEVRYAAPPAEFVRNGPALLLAGVFINTAGFLQTRAEETGQESSQQTTHRVTLAGSPVGVADDGLEQIQTIKINVKRVSASEDINLDNATMQWIGPRNVGTLTHDGSPGFTLAAIKDDDSSFPPVLNADSDVGQISIDLGQSGVNPLEPGQAATMTITTDAGGETEIRLSVPDTIQNRTVTLSP